MSEIPPEDPTRRLTPATPPVVERDVAYADPDAAVTRAAVLDDLRSLKRWLALIGVLALVALGAALYALLAEDEDGDGRGASRTSVRQLDTRVDDLESRIDDRATKNSVAEVRDQQRELNDRVDELSEQAADGGDAAAAEEAAEQLRSDVDELEQRVQAAEEAAEQAGADDGTP